MFIDLLKSLLFGIVEGITEWLPISSTGHMILLQQFVQMDVSEAFWDVFLVVIQLGAICAVIGLYFRRLNPFSSHKSSEQKHGTWSIWGKIAVGTIPAGIVGVALNDWAEAHLMNGLVVSIALIAYGIVFIVLEARNRRLIAEATQGRHSKAAIARQRILLEAEGNTSGYVEPDETDASSATAKVNDFSQLSYLKAFLIGCFQALAVVPGTSRSGSTIIGSMLLGTSRTIATEFAFFLSIPIMAGWSLVKFLKHGFSYSGAEWLILAVGCVAAFFISWLVIKFLIGYVKKHDFTVFGWYRIALGAAVIAYFAFNGQLLG